jgi:exodeoxyribonuclease VII small subunit
MVQEAKKQISAMSFEEAMKELENIVKDIESGSSSLEKTINDYEYGNNLRLHCEARLKESQMRVDKIIKKENEEIEFESFENESGK